MASSDSRRTSQTSQSSFSSANQNATRKRRDLKQKEMEVSIKLLEDNLERLKKSPMKTRQEAQTALEKGRLFANKFKAVKKSVTEKLGELNLSAADEDPRVEHIKSRLCALADNFNVWFAQAKKAQQGSAGSGVKPRESGGFKPLDNRRNSAGESISGSANSGSTGYLNSSGIDGNSLATDYTKLDESEDDASSKFPVISHKGNRVDKIIVEEEDGIGYPEVKTSEELQFRGIQNFGDEYGTGRVEGHCMEEQNGGSQNFGGEYGNGRVEGHCMEEQNGGGQNLGDAYGTERVEEQNRGVQNFGDGYGTGSVKGHCTEEQNRGPQNSGDEYGTGSVEGLCMKEQNRGTQNFGDEYGTGRVEGHSVEEQNVGLETVLVNENQDVLKEGSSFLDDRNNIPQMNVSVDESIDAQDLTEMVTMGTSQEQGCSSSSSGFVNDADGIQKDRDDIDYGHTSVAFEKYGAFDSNAEGFNKKDFEISAGEAEDKLHAEEPDIAVEITPPSKDLLENGRMPPVDTFQKIGKPVIQEFVHPPVDVNEKFGEPTIKEFVNTASEENLEEEKKRTVLENGRYSNGSANKDMESNDGVSEFQDHVAPAIISTGNEVSESTIDNETCTTSIIPKVEVQSLVHEEFDEVYAIREQNMDTDLCLAQWRNEVNFDKAESPLWRSLLMVKEDEDELNSLKECCYLHEQNMMFPEKILSPEDLNRTFLDKQSQAQLHGLYAQTTRSRFEDRAQEMNALDAAEENILQVAFGSKDESLSEITMMEEMLNHRRPWPNPINNSFKWPVIEDDLCLSNGVHSVADGQSEFPKLKKFTDAHPLEEAIKPVMDQQKRLQEALEVHESNPDENGRPPNMLAEKNINNNSSPSHSKEIIEESSGMNRKTRSMIEIINLGSPISEEEKQKIPFHQDDKIDVVDLVEDTELKGLHEHPLSKLTREERKQEIYADTEQADESGVEACHQPALPKQKLQDTPRQPKLKMGVEEPKAPTQGVPEAYKLKKEIKEENIPEDITTSLNSGSILSSVKKEVEEKPQYQVTQIRNKTENTVTTEFEEASISCSEEDLCEDQESKKHCKSNRLITGNMQSIRCEIQDEDFETHCVKSHLNSAGPRQSGRTLHIRNCTNWFFPEMMPELESISIKTMPSRTRKALNERVILQQKNQSSSVKDFEERVRGMKEHNARIREFEENFVESEAEQRSRLMKNLRKQWLLAITQSCMLGVAIFNFGFVSQQKFPPPT